MADEGDAPGFEGAYMEGRRMKRPFSGMGLIALAAALAWACESGGEHGASGPVDGDLDGASLEISPSSITLAVTGGVPERQRFTVRVHLRDGTTEDVSERAELTIGDPLLGRIEGAVLTARGTAAGESTVRASFKGLSATARVAVRVQHVRVVDPAPPEAPVLLRTAASAPELAPAIVYPTDQTVVPPNLGDFEVHWLDEASADLFEVTVSAGFVDVRVYVAGTPEAGSWVSLLPEEWAALGRSHQGEALSVTVRGMRRAERTRAGSAAPIAVQVTEQPVAGGIYYWAARSRGSASGIYRHDMARAGDRAEPFYTTQATPGKRCVGCHALSRDGTRMAVTYDGGDYSASILDVASRTEVLPLDTYYWNFATFAPGGERLLTAHKGEMTLRDAKTGEVISRIEDVPYATHPDFSPTGDAIAFVAARTPVHDWRFDGGSIMVASFDPDTGTFGPSRHLVDQELCQGPRQKQHKRNCFYPSWSPDGQWILFNKSAEDAYDDQSAELWVVPADGSMPPIELDMPNFDRELTNSWARWAPFEQVLGDQGERLFWFTFSSKRDFGVRLVGLRRPQIWMAPFFPERALRGEEPSAPAFRLPIQSVDSNNHIAQWTEQVVSVESQRGEP